MGVSLYIARRLSLASGGRGVSPAVSVAVVAVALSILVMMCAIAVVTGFKGEISSKVAGFNSHITITLNPTSVDPQNPTPLVSLSTTLKSILDSQPYIKDAALQASIPAILKTQSDFKGVYLKSLSGKNLNDFIGSAIVEGHMPDYSVDSCANHIVISRKAALQLGLHSGDAIDTYFITDAVRVRRLKISAIFDSHFDTYDDSFAYASLPLVQELGKLSDSQGTSIAVALTDFDDVDINAATLRQTLHDAYDQELIYKRYDVTTARQSGAAYFQWLDLLDMNVVVVLTLMTIVACITLVSGMLILMVDKVRFIALMSALGASRPTISRIFMLLAAKIAILGMLIGDALAIGLIYAQRATHFIPLDADSYYIDFVPVNLSWTAFIILNLAVLAIIWIVLILPSRFAGKAAPARTLAED